MAEVSTMNCREAIDYCLASKEKLKDFKKAEVDRALLVETFKAWFHDPDAAPFCTVHLTDGREYWMKRLPGKEPSSDMIVTAERKCKANKVTFTKVELLTGEVASISDQLIQFMEVFFRDFDPREYKTETGIYNEFMLDRRVAANWEVKAPSRNHEPGAGDEPPAKSAKRKRHMFQTFTDGQIGMLAGAWPHIWSTNDNR